MSIPLTLPPQTAYNPFTPDFGQMPPEMVGMDALLEDIYAGLAAGPRDPRFTTLLLGPRGSGKTVLLTAVEDTVVNFGWLALRVDAATPNLPERIKHRVVEARDLCADGETADPDFPHKRYSYNVRLPGGFAWGRAKFPSVRPAWDAQALLVALASHAAKHGTGVLLTVDEVYGGDRQELRRLVSDVQHITKRQGLPLAFLAAGLSDLKHTLQYDQKIAFWQRCSQADVPPLTQADAELGLGRPVETAGGAFASDALKQAAAAVRGSPYKLQLIGRNAWDIAGAPQQTITLKASELAVEAAENTLDKNVRSLAWWSIGRQGRDILRSLVSAGGQTEARSVTAAVGRPPASVAKTCSQLAASGYLKREDRALSLTDALPLRLLKEIIAREDEYDEYIRTDTQRPAAGRVQCRAWMPKAAARCVLTCGHKGHCRSRR